MKNQVKFHTVLKFPRPPTVLDLSTGSYPDQVKYSIGRYDENRSGVYQQEIFTRDQRTLHLGIDLGAPAGTPLHAFADGKIFLMADNQASGDYGATLITEHSVDGKVLYVLWGHLSLESLRKNEIGREIKAGEIFAWLGDESENGGWPPHVHIQLSWEKPSKADMPGVVSLSARDEALQKYPDPRLILGPIY